MDHPITVLAAASMAHVVVTDTVTTKLPTSPEIEVCSIAPPLATAIQRNHPDESLADLRASV